MSETIILRRVASDLSRVAKHKIARRGTTSTSGFGWAE